MTKRKKLLLIILPIAAVVLVGIVVLIVALAPKGLDDYVKWMEKSEKEVVSVRSDIEVTDSGVSVYGYGKTLEFAADGSVTATVSETKLNSAFQTETKETTETLTEADRESLLDFSLEKEGVKEYSYDDGVLTVVVGKDALKSVLGWESVETENDVRLAFRFESKKLTETSCSFQTTTGKTVTVRVVYGY
ncbi:MAG: hypothetical protein IJX91_04745 [Clostridia bacterium]|nr:hypothetical protein [Clostridia bacterium]